MLCITVVILGMFYVVVMALVLASNYYLADESCADYHSRQYCSAYQTVADVVVIVTALIWVFGYHGCEFLCWLRFAWQECMAWDPELSGKKLRMTFVQTYMSLQKSIFIILFVWIYHTHTRKSGDRIAITILNTWPYMARLMCLLVGVCWFFDLYLNTVFEVSAEHGLNTQANTRGQNKYQVLCCCFSHQTIEAGPDLSVTEQKSWGYAKMFLRVHMRWHTPGHRPWDKPTEGEINAVEDVMTGQHVHIMPCCVRNWNTTSIEEYLMLFTFFHMTLVIYNMITTAWGHSVDNNQFVQVYSMFPLGFFLGEKLMIIYTGFIPWWSEFLDMKKDKEYAAWAWLGLVINLIDFGMVFFSIFDDCLDQTNFNLFLVLLMMFVDEAFDFIAIGKKGNRFLRSNNDANPDYHKLEEQVK